MDKPVSLPVVTACISNLADPTSVQHKASTASDTRSANDIRDAENQMFGASVAIGWPVSTAQQHGMETAPPWAVHPAGSTIQPAAHPENGSHPTQLPGPAHVLTTQQGHVSSTVVPQPNTSTRSISTGEDRSRGKAVVHVWPVWCQHFQIIRRCPVYPHQQHHCSSLQPPQFVPLDQMTCGTGTQWFTSAPAAMSVQDSRLKMPSLWFQTCSEWWVPCFNTAAPAVSGFPYKNTADTRDTHRYSQVSRNFYRSTEISGTQSSAARTGRDTGQNSSSGIISECSRSISLADAGSFITTGYCSSSHIKTQWTVITVINQGHHQSFRPSEQTRPDRNFISFP